MANENEQKIKEMQEELNINEKEDFSYIRSVGERIQSALDRSRKIAEDNPYAPTYMVDIQYLTEVCTLMTMLTATIADNLNTLTQLVAGANSGVKDEV